MPATQTKWTLRDAYQAGVNHGLEMADQLNRATASETTLAAPTTAQTPSRTRSPKKRRTRGATPTVVDLGNNRLRRIPNWLMQATGQKTKAALVQRYGAGARFEQGKPLPPTLAVPATAIKAAAAKGKGKTKGARAPAAPAPQAEAQAAAH